MTALRNELTWPKEAVKAWVDSTLDEVALSARRKPQVVARETGVDFELPYGAFDSPSLDARLVSNEEGAILGAGSAVSWDSEELSSMTRMRAALSDLPQSSVLMGGWSLPAPRAGRTRERNGFPRATWVLPSLTFVSRDGRSRVILCARLSSKLDELKHHLHGLLDEVFQPERTARANVVSSTSIPSKKQWVSLAESALGSISRGRFRKVVLARSLRMTFDSEVRVSAVLRRLVRSNPASTAFAIKRGASTFLGATPERLLSLRSRQVIVDCLAATAPRSHDRSVDDSLGRELLEDAKSRTEQQLVVDGVVRAINPVCSQVRVSGPPKLRKLATVQHLQSFVTGKLRPGRDAWSAALAIWPTAATGGEPREPALRWIRDHELLDRGWYSGVVGVVRASGDADLAVAIRSGLVEGKTAVVYGGAGILEGSNPEAEFAETGWKMRTMVDALTGQEA